MHLREYLSYERADIIDRLQHQLDAAPEAPVYWQADVRAIVQANAKALLAKTPPRLGDWPEDIDDNGCASALAAELNGMADALEHWPALVAARGRAGREAADRAVTSFIAKIP